MEKRILVNILHIVIIGSLFLYIGITKTTFPFPALLILGLFVTFYHIYKAITNPTSAWVNYIHIFLVGPLLIYIGYKGKDTPRKYFEYLLMLGFAAIGYHGYYLLTALSPKSLNNQTTN